MYALYAIQDNAAGDASLTPISDHSTLSDAITDCLTYCREDRVIPSYVILDFSNQWFGSIRAIEQPTSDDTTDYVTMQVVTRLQNGRYTVRYVLDSDGQYVSTEIQCVK